MVKRKNKIIDKGFQLKTTFSILGMTIIAFLSIIAIMGIDASLKSREITRTIDNLNNAIEVENNIVKAFLEYAKETSSSVGQSTITEINQDHNTSIEGLRKNVELLQQYERRNFIMISLIIAIVILLFIILYYYLIRLTHRISGPLHVIENYMKDITEGRNPDFRDLRDKDEFQNLYDTFKKMSEEIRKRNG